jgi:hypothetical protein
MPSNVLTTPNVASLSTTPASSIDPSTGASAWANRSQTKKGNRGVLAPKLSAKVIHKPIPAAEEQQVEKNAEAQVNPEGTAKEVR